MNNKQGTITVHEGDLSALWRPAGSQKPFALTADVVLGFLNINGRWFSRFDSMFWKSPEKVPNLYGAYPDGSWASGFHWVPGSKSYDSLVWACRSAVYVKNQEPDEHSSRRAFKDVCWGLIHVWDDLDYALANTIQNAHTRHKLPHLVLPWFGTPGTYLATAVNGGLTSLSDRTQEAHALTRRQLEGIILALKRMNKPINLSVIVPPSASSAVNWVNVLAHQMQELKLDKRLDVLWEGALL
jgi:hypothetical protein